MPRKKAVTPEEAARLEVWGEIPTTWHEDAKFWYDSLRSINREWSRAEVAHARSLADDLSHYKEIIPRNAAMAKVIYTEMNFFLTTPKAFDDAKANLPVEQVDFRPDVDTVANFMGQMKFGPTKKEANK